MRRCYGRRNFNDCKRSWFNGKGSKGNCTWSI